MSSSIAQHALPHSSLTTQYDPFASLYDRYMAVDFARRVMPVIARLALAHLAAGAAVLDVCCGTGRVSQQLVEHGFRVTGVDASESMLRLARRNAAGAEFFLADVRRIVLMLGHSAVVSTFNSLAHLHTLSDLTRALRNAHAALAPGGVIVFDLSMAEQYRRCWQGSYSLVGAEGGCTIRPSYDPETRLARNDITVLLPGKQACLEPQAVSRFTIWQKCHGESEARQALADAGFQRVESFDAERDLGMAGESGRRFFRAWRV